MATFPKTYMASELILKLVEFVNEHGDMPVVADDPDTDWRLEIGVVVKEADDDEGWPKRIEIKSCYHDFWRPAGNCDEDKADS